MIDSQTWKLMFWLQRLVDFNLTEQNMWVGALSMVTKNLETDIKVVDKDLSLEFDSTSLIEYQNVAPVSLGGRNSHPSRQDIMKTMNICYKIVLDYFAKKANSNKRYFIVVKDNKMANDLYEKINDKSKVQLLTNGKSINLTDPKSNIKTVIAPIRHSTGYNLTALDHMLISIYPSNQANREQIRGRINRVGQTSETVTYTTVHLGILSAVFERQMYTQSMAALIKQFEKK